MAGAPLQEGLLFGGALVSSPALWGSLWSLMGPAASEGARGGQAVPKRAAGSCPCFSHLRMWHTHSSSPTHDAVQVLYSVAEFPGGRHANSTHSGTVA